MITIENIREMQEWSERERRAGGRIAFVPTMGFLHDGHLELVREGKKRGDRLVVSIFVNPAQFGPQEDFAGYPRDLERDKRLLESEGVDVIFHPAVDEMYPAGYQTYVEVEKLGRFLCGALRPGHFRGVATILVKLFNSVRPHTVVLGAKDYQQLRIVQRMVEDLNFPIEVVGHPIVREKDGLAMSSRNAYLADEERQAALSLSRSLKKAESLVRSGETQSRRIVEAIQAEIEKEPLARLEYARVCHPESLEEVERIDGSALLALAVRVGKARLIDNALLTRRVG
jgi:pantoate--beta-alanine ligase